MHFAELGRPEGVGHIKLDIDPMCVSAGAPSSPHPFNLSKLFKRLLIAALSFLFFFLAISSLGSARVQLDSGLISINMCVSYSCDKYVWINPQLCGWTVTTRDGPLWCSTATKATFYGSIGQDTAKPGNTGAPYL